MKLKQIALACTVALAVPMAVQAVPPTGPYDTAGAMRVFMLDGYGDNGITNDKILESLLKPGFYKYTAGIDYHLYLGETIATGPIGTIGFPTNQKVLFINRSKNAAAWAAYVYRCPLPPLQTMILNSSVCPTAAVAGGAAGICNTSGTNSAIVGQDPGSIQTGQEEIPDFFANLMHPFMFQPPLNNSFGFGGGC